MRRRKPVRRTPLPSMKELRKYNAARKNRVKPVEAKLEEPQAVEIAVAEEPQAVPEPALEEEIKEPVQEEPAKEEPAKEEPVQEEPDLSELEKEELVAKAKELGISARKNWSKSTLISKIKAAE